MLSPQASKVSARIAASSVPIARMGKNIPPVRLQELARQTAKEEGIDLREGVYFYCYGPQYETPAEIRAARILGGDAVGMSTAPEVIVAGHCGMEVLGLTLLSNMAAGILDQPLSEEEVLTAAAEAREKFSGLVRACLRKM